ncbi:MAG: sulfatase, partial [Planctomycetota bacterium]
MFRAHHLAWAALVLMATCGALRAADPAAAPNIVFILMDDVRFDGLSATGHPFLQTPNIDRIADEGINFTNAFVTTPLCSPGRASFYTGQYARTHGVLGNDGNNAVHDTTLTTYSELLQQAGYETAYVGKMHNFTSKDRAAPRPGFDYWTVFPGQGVHADSDSAPLNINENGSYVRKSGYMTDVLTDYAVSFIQQSHAQPFAMTLAYKAVHGPFNDPNGTTQYPQKYVDEVNGTYPQRPNATSPPDPNLVISQARMAKHVDDAVGRVLAALESTGQLDNTLIVFTSDNGYFYREHGLGDKRAPYDEALRIPLVMRLPGMIGAGTTSESIALNIDMAPTFLDLAGVAIPGAVQGKSLVPVLGDPSQKVRTSFLAEYYQEVAFPNVQTWNAIRTEDWKYVTYLGQDPSNDLLFDLRNDPYELTNLAGDQTKQSIVAQLQAELGQLIQGADRAGGSKHVILGSSLDYVLRKDASGNVTSGNVTGPQARLGYNTGNPAGGRNAVLLFALPKLGADEVLSAVSLQVRGASEIGGTPSTMHGDLWAIGVGDGTPLIEYLDTDGGDLDPTNVKLGDDVITLLNSPGAFATNRDTSDALLDYLNDFYADNPEYEGGEYLYLRFNPDGLNGTSNAGW